MKKVLVCLLLVIVIFAIPTISNAEETKSSGTIVTIDLSDLSDSTRNQVYEMIKEKKEKAEKTIEVVKDVTPEKMQTYASVAKEISTAIKEIASNLNIEVNNFAKTPVGYMSFGLLIWHYAGQTIVANTLEAVGGSIFWIVLLCVLNYVSKRTIFKTKVERVIYADDGKTIKEKTYDLVSNFERGSEAYGFWVVALIIAFAGGTLLSLMIIF